MLADWWLHFSISTCHQIPLSLLCCSRKKNPTWRGAERKKAHEVQHWCAMHFYCSTYQTHIFWKVVLKPPNHLLESAGGKKSQEVKSWPSKDMVLVILLHKNYLEYILSWIILFIMFKQYSCNMYSKSTVWKTILINIKLTYFYIKLYPWWPTSINIWSQCNQGIACHCSCWF